MSYHDKFVRRAICVARQSAHHKWFLGAVAVRDREVIGFAPNKFRKNPWLDQGSCSTFHAEEAVLRPLVRRLRSV